MKQKNIDMLNGNILSNIIRFTVPVILTGVLQLLFNAADLIVVGRFCGSASVGAVGATSSLSHLIINLFIGISLGAGVCAAHAVGAKNDETLSKTVHTAIPTAVICGVIVTVLGIVLAEPILKIMDTPSDFLHLSVLYTEIYFSGSIALLVFNFGASILRAVGDSRSPLIYLTLSGVLNVILNVIFVTVFHLNVAGVALATVISQILSAVLVIIALMRRKDACRLVLSKMNINPRVLMKIIKIGVPAGIQASLFSISNIFIQSSFNSFGSTVVAGCSASGNIEGFTYTIMNSFHQTALNFTGQNAGAGNFKRAKKIFIYCLISVFVCGVVAGGLSFIFGKPLLSIYITDSPEAIAVGFVRLAYISLPYFLCGIMDVASGALRGLGVSTGPMFISVLGICGVRLLWIYTIFQVWHTPECLHISYSVSWFLTFLAQLIMFIIVYKRKNASISLKLQNIKPIE